jgi:hypothetical protein
VTRKHFPGAVAIIFIFFFLSLSNGHTPMPFDVMLAWFYLLTFDLLCIILHMHCGKNYFSITLHIAITKWKYMIRLKILKR